MEGEHMRHGCLLSGVELSWVRPKERVDDISAATANCGLVSVVSGCLWSGCTVLVECATRVPDTCFRGPSESLV